MESDLIDLFNEIHSIPILVNVLSILMTCTFASYAIFFSRGGGGGGGGVASAKHLGVQKYFYYYYNIFTEDETIQYKNTAINLCPLYKVQKYIHRNIYKYYKMYEK